MQKISGIAGFMCLCLCVLFGTDLALSGDDDQCDQDVQEEAQVTLLQTDLRIVEHRHLHQPKDRTDSRMALRQELAQGEAVVTASAAHGWGDVLHNSIQMVEILNPGSTEAEEAQDVQGQMALGDEVDPIEAMDVLNKAAEQESVSEAIHNREYVTADMVRAITGNQGDASDCGGNAKDCAGGDMMVSPSQQQAAFLQGNSSRGKFVGAGMPWPDGIVKFCFASDVSDRIKNIFRAGAAQFQHAVPCLSFEEVGNSAGLDSSLARDQVACDASPAIFVQSLPGAGCWSQVGYVPAWSAQPLQMEEPGCDSLGVAIHEIGHALGMAHEHSRPDRDNFVTVHANNIKAGKESNFDIDPDGHVGSTYDFTSVMHYDQYTFSSNDQPTLTSISGAQDDLMGQRVGLAQSDADQIALMYAEVKPSCAAQSLASTEGCVDKDPTMCSALSECFMESHMDNCCGCGGGLLHQCWQGQACDSPPAIPVRDLFGQCIEDNTASYTQYACVVKNTCPETLHIECPDHPAASWNWAGYSNDVVPPYGTDVCQQKCVVSLKDGGAIAASTTTPTPAEGTGSDCIIDYTHLFSSYSCVVKNTCPHVERVRCPSFPGYIWDFSGVSGYMLPPWDEVCAGVCSFEVLS